jgi:hypothetical protein
MRETLWREWLKTCTPAEQRRVKAAVEKRFPSIGKKSHKRKLAALDATSPEHASVKALIIGADPSVVYQ